MLDQVFGATAPALTLTTSYVSLAKAGVVFADTGTTIKTGKEPDTGTEYVSYGRASNTNNTTIWPNASGAGPSSKSNASTAFTFPASTGGGPVTLSYWAITDNTYANGGNLFAFGTLSVAQSVASGDTPSFAAGAITVTLG